MLTHIGTPLPLPLSHPFPSDLSHPASSKKLKNKRDLLFLRQNNLVHSYPTGERWAKSRKVIEEDRRKLTQKQLQEYN